MSITASSALAVGVRRGSGIKLILLAVSILVILLNRMLIPNITLDSLNILPALAALYIAYCVVTLETTFQDRSLVSRCLSSDASVRKPFGCFLLSRAFRSALLLVLIGVTAEFSLRCLSYHRALFYERQGDLLFTPIPNQLYVEKISLTHSQINNYGLRGGPADLGGGKTKILCLGDSITYGYGVDDEHTYPALLQKDLDRKYPRRFAILNGGVDAYPMSFIRQKFLYLYDRGIHPDIVIVGYSMNEGWLGRLVDVEEQTKQAFARRVWLKNHLRSFALYNLVVENWARNYYNHMKGKLVPGTNSATLSKEDLEVRYDRTLARMLADLRARHVQPVFFLFCGFNGQTGRYDTEGPFERHFADFAQRNGIPLLRSDEILRKGLAPNADLAPYFIDQCHMNERGTPKVANKLADFLPAVPGRVANGL